MLKVNKQVLREIKYYVDQFDTEVSGMGLVKNNGDHFEVIKIFLPEKQKNSGANTELDQEELAKLQYDLIRKNEINETTSLSFWWHSHANMGVFWSGTDDENIRRNGCDGLFFSGVYNKKGESLYSLYAHNAINIGGIVSDYYDKNLKIENEADEIPDTWIDNVKKTKAHGASIDQVNKQSVWLSDWRGGYESWRTGFEDYAYINKQATEEIKEQEKELKKLKVKVKKTYKKGRWYE